MKQMIDLNQIPSPCFVLEEELLDKNLAVFERLERESGVHALCALKGFAFHHVFPKLASRIHGATASSLNEAILASTHFEHVHACAPVYIDSEFDQMVQLSSHVTFNSISQYNRFKDRLDGKIPMLRINPEYSEVDTPMYNPCATDGRLGVTLAEMEAYGGIPEGIQGLHVHALCENDSYTLERLLKVIEDNFGIYLSQLTYLNIGGGHLVTKKEYDVAHLISELNRIKEKFNVQVIMEPGSAYGWQTGFLRAKIEDVLLKDDLHVAMLDASFSAHMPDTLEMPYQPVIRGFSQQSGQYKIKFGGNTCLAGDQMGLYYTDRIPEFGDDVILEDMIHYTMVKTTTFNGVNLPSIGMIHTNGEFELLKSPSYQDYISRI